MPNSKQASKRMRQDDDQRIRNKVTRSAMRTSVKKVLQAETAEEAQAQLPLAMKRVDKAAKHNVIHDNAAARIKSRMTTTVNSK